MKISTLYRKRLIPNECVLLDSDIILHSDESTIVTKWTSIKPKKDLHHGCSCYLLKEGIKISKFYRADNTLMYWYCDIVDYDYDEMTGKMIVTDLLADVIIYPDDYVKVVDLDELADAFHNGLISAALLEKSLKSTNDLLELIYSGTFQQHINFINSFE